jgi:hypothetical protein
MAKDLETIYEEILTRPLVLSLIKNPIPLDPLDSFESEIDEEEEEEEEEDLTEKEEVDLAREILTHVSELDDLAKEAMYKSFRKKIEHCADCIRDLANELIEGHGYNV